MRKKWILASVLGLAVAFFIVRGDGSATPSTGTGDTTSTVTKLDDDAVTDNEVPDTDATSAPTNAATTELTLESPEVPDTAELGKPDMPDSPEALENEDVLPDPEALDSSEELESPEVLDTSRHFPIQRLPKEDEPNQVGVGVGIKW